MTDASTQRRPASGAGDAVESQPTVLAEGGTIAHRVSTSGIEDAFVGTELGGTYKVIDVLAEGGMGRLYEAEHVRIGRRYVVKIIHTPLAHRDDLKQRFDREARAMAKVRSDHVIDVVDVLNAPDGRTCIITEKLEGQDLDRKLGALGRMPVGEAVHLVRQACRGLAAAHAQGIVHRDLKPSNLFLARDAGGGTTLKILDFGVAKVGGDAEMTGTGVIVGTPAYMAPEQARSAGSADARADVYALGAVLYRALTGQAPYGGGEASATLVRLLEESPQRPSIVEKSVPPAIEAVIEKAMARDPGERFATAVELDAALAPFDEPSRSTLAGTMSTIPAPDAKALGRKARLARPLAVALASLAALSAAIGVGVTLALVVDGLSSTTTIGTPELVLVGIGTAVAFGLAAASAYRALTSAWRSVAMVDAVTGRFARVLLVGLATLGTLELSASAYAALHLHQPASNDPLWAAARTLIALGAGGAAAVLARPKR